MSDSTQKADAQVIHEHDYADHNCPKCQESLCYSCAPGYWVNPYGDGRNIMRCVCGHEFDI